MPKNKTRLITTLKFNDNKLIDKTELFIQIFRVIKLLEKRYHYEITDIEFGKVNLDILNKKTTILFVVNDRNKHTQ